MTPYALSAPHPTQGSAAGGSRPPTRPLLGPAPPAPRHYRDPPIARVAESSAAIDALLAQGRLRYPDVRVARSAFARFVTDGNGATGLPAKLDPAGLVLACACVEGDPEALRTFEREHGVLLKAAVPASLRSSNALPDDFQSMVRERLFVGAAGRPPLLRKYAGLGPLGGWLRIMIGRAAISAARRRAVDRNQVPLEMAPDLDAGPTPEQVCQVGGYRRRLAAALRAAIHSLSPREVDLIRASMLQGSPVRALARTYGVHHATIARWVQSASEKLVRGTRRALAEQLAESDLADMGRMLREHGESANVLKLVLSPGPTDAALVPAGHDA